MMHWRKWKGLVNISISNPFKTWWRARKYFKRPKTRFKCGFNVYLCPFVSTNYVGKILDIYIRDVQWKDKYNSPRHEQNPMIWIHLFSKFTICIYPEVTYKNEFGEDTDSSYVYWEYLLDYLYYSKTLKCYPTWVGTSLLYKHTVKDTEEYYYTVVPSVSMSLNKKGIKQLKKELNK